MSPRATDQTPGRGRTLHIWWQRLGRDLVTMFAVGLAAYAIHEQNSETATRRDQLCSILEQREQTDVDALKRTYEYLAGLSVKQLGEPLNRAVLAQLPSTVRAAETPDAPLYCDDPGVGLPEPARPVGLPKPPTNLPKP